MPRMTTTEEIIGQRIKAARLSQNLTQPQLVERLKDTPTPLSQPAVSQIERGYGVWRPKGARLTRCRLLSFSMALGVEVDELASPEELSTLSPGTELILDSIGVSDAMSQHVGYVEDGPAVAKRIIAYGRFNGAQNVSALARKLRLCGHPYTRTDVSKLLNKYSYRITYDFVSAVADSYSTRRNQTPFDPKRLLSCTDHVYKCPCCDPDFG